MSESLYHKESISFKSERLLSAQAMVIEAGGVITIRVSTRNGAEPKAIRIDADHYCRTDTGEILPIMKRADKRTDNIASLKRSMSNLRDIINANFGLAVDRPRVASAWITVTYRENVRDTVRVCEDWEAFIRWVRNYHKAKVEYITVIEPQRRGAWHLHGLIFRPDGQSVFIPHGEMLKAWRSIAARKTPAALLTNEDGTQKSAGGLHVHSLEDGGDNIGAYLSAYLTNEDGKKGSRLSLYPAGLKYYRVSQGCARPQTRREATAREAIRKAAETAGTPTFESIYRIEDENGKTVSEGATIQFKIKP